MLKFILKLYAHLPHLLQTGGIGKFVTEAQEFSKKATLQLQMVARGIENSAKFIELAMTSNTKAFAGMHGEMNDRSRSDKDLTSLKGDIGRLKERIVEFETRISSMESFMSNVFSMSFTSPLQSSRSDRKRPRQSSEVSETSSMSEIPSTATSPSAPKKLRSTHKVRKGDGVAPTLPSTEAPPSGLLVDSGMFDALDGMVDETKSGSQPLDTSQTEVTEVDSTSHFVDVPSHMRKGSSADGGAVKSKMGESQPKRSYSVGTRVDVRFNGGEKWHPATIETADRRNGLYSVHYDDGDVEENVPIPLIRLHRQESCVACMNPMSKKRHTCERARSTSKILSPRTGPVKFITNPYSQVFQKGIINSTKWPEFGEQLRIHLKLSTETARRGLYKRSYSGYDEWQKRLKNREAELLKRCNGDTEEVMNVLLAEDAELRKWFDMDDEVLAIVLERGRKEAETKVKKKKR